MRLPDSERSRAVLIGTSTYAPDSGFESLPTVTRNLTEFASLLRSHTGLRHVTVLPDPADAEAFSDALEPAIEQAEDLLLFYYSGHGVAVGRNDLGLTHTCSRSNRPGFTTLRYSDIRDRIRESGAAVKVVILDCCHSGRAFGTDSMAGLDQNEVLNELAVIQGTYVLTATDTIRKFAASAGPEGCTAFTGTLLNVLRTGTKSSAEYLSMAAVFPLLRRELRGAGFPEPRSSGRDSASQLALIRNQKHTQADEARVEARRQRDIKGWSTRADTATQEGDWDTVVSALENLTAIDPTNSDAASRLEHARIQRCRSHLFDMVSSRNALDYGQQRQVLSRLEAALKSDDPRKRQGGREVLDRFRRRDDLYADVDRRIVELIKPSRPAFSSPIPATLIAVAALIGQIPPIRALSTNYEYNLKIWLFQTAARIFIGIAFFILAWMADSLGEKVAMLSAALMAPVILLHLVTESLRYVTDDMGADVDRLLKVVAYPTVLALAAMVGILFGVAVIRKYRVAWASVLIAWGVCGLLEAYLSYEAKIAPWEPGEPPAAAWGTADKVLIVQNLILLAVAVFMFVESRPAKNDPRGI